MLSGRRGLVQFSFGFVGKHQYFESDAAAAGSQWREHHDGLVWEDKLFTNSESVAKFK